MCIRDRSTEDDILILDPESEFGSLVEALNGEVISISATSHTHLNALDTISYTHLWHYFCIDRVENRLY